MKHLVLVLAILLALSIAGCDRAKYMDDGPEMVNDWLYMVNGEWISTDGKMTLTLKRHYGSISDQNGLVFEGALIMDMETLRMTPEEGILCSAFESLQYQDGVIAAQWGETTIVTFVSAE